MEHECEEQGCTSTDTEVYHWLFVKPGEPETSWYCYDHAIESGFCVWCRNFGAGGEDYDFSGHPGYHGECFEELRYDIGEYDEDEEFEDDFGFDYYEDWYDPKSPLSEIEPEDTPRTKYIGPGSEYEGGEE